MRICIVSFHRLDAPLRRLGHEVLSLDPPQSGDLDLPQALDRAGFVPDLVLERENLGRSFFLDGLDDVDCPAVFWSLDTHLNHFWQRRTAPLYDLVLTTQPSFVQALGRAGAPRAACLPWFSKPRPFTPWAQRRTPAAFVGRLSEQRPARTAMVRLLEERHGLKLHTDVTSARMGEIYADARLVPNETIAGEVNLRIFEAAACGCLPLSPAQATDQEEFFEPGREFLPFADALELLDLMRWAEDNPAQAEQMALRALVRSEAEHLPAHRAQRLLDLTRDLCGGRTRGQEAERLRLLARFELWQGERMAAQPLSLARQLAAWPLDPACAAARLCLAELGGQREAALEQARRVAATDALARDPECALAASALAWRAGDAALARHLLARCQRLAEGREGPTPDAPARFWIAWGGLMRRAGLLRRTGFAFNDAGHLPATASDCLHLARLAAPGDVTVLRRAEEFLRDAPEAAYVRAGVLSELALRRRADWRLALDLGLAELGVFRPEQGLAELRLALGLAREAGAEAAFLARLGQLDRRGRLLRALAGRPAGVVPAALGSEP